MGVTEQRLSERFVSSSHCDKLTGQVRPNSRVHLAVIGRRDDRNLRLGSARPQIETNPAHTDNRQPINSPLARSVGWPLARSLAQTNRILLINSAHQFAFCSEPKSFKIGGDFEESSRARWLGPQQQQQQVEPEPVASLTFVARASSGVSLLTPVQATDDDDTTTPSKRPGIRCAIRI